MKFCTNCGAELNGAKFCTNCGKAADIASAAPLRQLKTNRGLVKFILLSAITFGIYALVVMSTVGEDINTIASSHDGRNTMHYCIIALLLSWPTLGIASLLWYHNVSSRIGAELQRRGISYKLSAGTFWGWGFFGALIFVGPFIYIHKLLKAMNLLAADYNAKG